MTQTDAIMKVLKLDSETAEKKKEEINSQFKEMPMVKMAQEQAKSSESENVGNNNNGSNNE
jgi:hypothetical protein